MSNYIWVFAEQKDGSAAETTLELLGEAKKQAKKLDAEVIAVAPGQVSEECSDEMLSYGATKVCVFDDERLGDFSPELYLSAFEAVKAEYAPKLVLISATPNGLCLGPMIAAKFGYRFISNAQKLAVAPSGGFEVSRSVYAGKVHETHSTKGSEVLVASFTPGSIGVDKKSKPKGERIEMHLPEDLSAKSAVTGFVKADPAEVSLAEAVIVAAGGNGYKDQEDFQLVWDFAGSLGAAVGGSKPVVDAGIVPRHRLIGQSSGRTIGPDLFVGSGISGSTYFIAGMKDAHNIVAINKDPGTPLMKMADLAIVGDMREILPALKARLDQEAREE